MSNRVYDYDALEKEFLAGDMSIRELCRRNGIRNHSVVHEQARRRKWSEKRDRVKGRVVELSIDQIAARQARRMSRIEDAYDLAVEAIIEAIIKMREDMRLAGDDGVKVYPKDLSILIDKLQTMLGRPTTISEERHLGAFTQLDPDQLMEVLRQSRENGANARTVGRSALPRIEGPSPH